MAFSCHLLNQCAHRGAACEADVVDAGVTRQRITHLMTITRHDIDRAGWKTHLGRQLGDTDQTQTGVFGRFDHAGVTGRQGTAHAAAKNLHRVVPWNHMAGDAMRLAPGQHAVAVLVGQGLAVQFVASACVIFKIASEGRGVCCRLLGGFAAITLFQCAQFCRMLAHFA